MRLHNSKQISGLTEATSCFGLTFLNMFDLLQQFSSRPKVLAVIQTVTARKSILKFVVWLCSQVTYEYYLFFLLCTSLLSVLLL